MNTRRHLLLQSPRFCSLHSPQTPPKTLLPKHKNREAGVLNQLRDFVVAGTRFELVTFGL